MTRTKIPIDNRSPFQEKIPSDDAAAAFRPLVTPHPRSHASSRLLTGHAMPYAFCAVSLRPLGPRNL